MSIPFPLRSLRITSALALAMVAGSCAAASASPGDFRPATTSPEAVGTKPTSVAVGDFNGDGKRDVATANAASDDVTILLGDGAGDFTPPATSPEAAGRQPSSMAVGDFDGNGKEDLAIADFASSNVTILLGDGAGDFTPASTGPERAGGGPISVAVGDFDGDHKQDVAALNNAGSVTILLGNGSGDFTPAASSPERVGPGPAAVAVGDFDRDGKQDLATADFGSDSVSILLGDGTGNFTAAATSPEAVGDGPGSVAIGDFDADGKQDIAAANHRSSNITVLLGDGTGNFTPAATSPEPVGIRSVAVAVGDLNGDGKQDLAAVDFLSDNLTVLVGNGTGDFAPAATRLVTGDGPLSIAISDFDGDGSQDLATANINSNNVTILLGEQPPAAADDSNPVAEDAGATPVDAPGHGVPEVVTAPPAQPTQPAQPAQPVLRPPSLSTGHRRVLLVNGRVVLRIACRGASTQACAGNLTLEATSRGSRLRAAADGRARFTIAAGHSKTIRVKPSRALRTAVRKRGKVVAQLTARMTGDGAARGTLKRLITIQPAR